MGMTFIGEVPRSVMDFIVEKSTRAQSGNQLTPIMISNLDNETYFVAVQRIDSGGNEVSVHMEVYDIDLHPHAVDGMVFGYRRFHEAEGPFRYGCPPRLIDVLTGNDLLYTRKWRMDNHHFNGTKEGRGCVRDAIITDLRTPCVHPSTRF
jgi:hypothetical protein